MAAFWASLRSPADPDAAPGPAAAAAHALRVTWACMGCYKHAGKLSADTVCGLKTTMNTCDTFQRFCPEQCC